MPEGGLDVPRRLAAADRDLAAHNGISEREAAQAQTDAASAEADRVAALQALSGMDHLQEVILQNFVPHRRYYGEEPAEIATDVLIIEDETFIAMDLESLVESLGHHVLGLVDPAPRERLPP